MASYEEQVRRELEAADAQQPLQCHITEDVDVELGIGETIGKAAKRVGAKIGHKIRKIGRKLGIVKPKYGSSLDATRKAPGMMRRKPKN